MTDTRGTFRLKEVRQDILNDEYVSMPSIYVGENQNVGYTKCYNQFQYKLNFSTEVSTVTTHQVVYRLSPTATSNPTHAWYIGGEYSPSGNPGYVTDSQKITYATDTAADNPSSRLPGPRAAVGGLSGQSHSYLMGGIPYTLTTVSKLTYANDTTVDLPGSHLSAAVYNVQSGTAGGASGYIFAGGTSDYSETQRITFSNDTRTTLPSSSRMEPINENGSGDGVPYWGAGKMQCSTHCYYAGGNPSGGNYTSTFQKLTFANETWAVNPSKMSRAVRNVGGFTASPTQGAIAGGQTPSGGSGTSSVDFVTFETDTWDTSPSMTLPATPGGTAGAYYNQVSTTTIHDSMHSGTPGLPLIDKRWVDNASTSNMDFYYGGGFHPYEGSNIVSTFFKITDSTDTHSNIGNMPVSKSGFVFRGNDTDARITGGDPYYPVGSRTEKFTYSSTTFEALPSSSNLNTRERKNAGGIGTKEKMIVAGGGPIPSGHTSFEKLTYGTDTWSTINYYLTRYGLGPSYGLECSHAGGNKTHGYIMGKYGAPSPWYATNVDKYTYSTDTCDVIPSYNPRARDGSSAASETALYAFAYGGYSFPGKNAVPKLSFATDTVETISTSLTSSKYYTNQGGSGNRSHGRLMNFGSPFDNSTAYKFDYTTETWSTANPSGNVKGGMTTNAVEWIGGYTLIAPPEPTPTRSGMTIENPAVSVSGYFSAGTEYPANLRSVTDKLTFSTDTTARVPGSNTPSPKHNAAGSSSTTKGYASGGFITWGIPATSNINSLTYSNNTWANIPSALLNPTGGNYAVNSITNSYSGGGGYSSDYSNIDKLTFATETPSKSIAQFTGATGGYNSRASGTAVGNAEAGYFCGGRLGPTSSINEKTSDINKLTYSTDTVALSLTLSLSTNNNAMGGTPNNFSFGKNDVGYVCGGQEAAYSSTVNKLTYSTETRSFAPTLWNGSGFSEAVSSNSAGYISMNLFWASPSANWLGYKMPYSSETWTAGPSLPLSTSRYRCTGFSAAMNSNGFPSVPNVI